MNLYVILLPLIIQGLALGCCEEYDADDVSGEGSWDQDDWNKSGDTSTGEDDNFTGFKSGSSSTDKAEDDEQPKFYPRISQTHSNRIFVTSGVGEDKGGSKHDGRSHYSSENSGNQENNEDFGSSMDLSKVGDAIDVMKRLKKAKSDQEFAKKLRSGPESLGVAFKTFEQLSGLWISVMHRIWRVWKAKGAKVVMHSIVNDMVHNTGRAITQKLGKMLNNTIDVNMNSSGSAAFDKDDGSTEPEKKHRIDTVHHQTDLPVQRVSIDFIKNVSSIGRKSSHTKPIKEPEEKVKVSFLKRNMNESKPKLKSETHNLMKNTMSIIQKTSEEKENKNFTSIRDKSETRSTLVPKITLPVSLTNGEEKRSSTNNTLVIINKENHKNVDADTEKSKSDPRKGEIQKEKQHIKIIDVKERENNSSKKSSGDSLRREDESRPEIKLRGEDNSARGGGGKRPVELVKPAVKQLSAINKATNDDQRDQNNTKSFFPKRKVSQNKVNTSRSEMERVKKSGKSTALETMRINFLKRNRTSLSDPKTTLSYVIGSETRGNNVLPALLNTSNTPLHNKSISRNDSSTLHKSTSAVESNYRETYPTGKRILNVEKSQTNKEPYAQRDKNSSRKGLTGNNTTTTSDVLPKRTKKPPSAKSENIVIKLNGKKGASKVNKANDTVHENFKAMDTHEVKEGIDINYMQRNVTAKMKTDAIKETSPAQFSDNSVLTHQKRLTSSRKNVKESKITSEAALNTLQANKTVTKENTLTKRKNVSNSERGFSNSQNGGITYNKEATRGDVQKARYKNPMRIVVQIENRTQTKKNEKGKLVDDISFPLKKEPQKGAAISVARGESQQKIIVTSQKLGSSKGAIRKVTEEKAKQDPLDSKNETRKDQTNSKSKTLEGKEKIEIKLNLKRGVPSGKASISHAPNSMLGRKDKKGSENYINDTQHLQGNSMPVKDENRHRSFSNKILANHPEKSDKLEGRDNATNGPVKTRVTQGPGNGVTHASGSGVTHASGSGVTHDSGGGSKDYRGRSVTRDSTVDTRHDPGSGSIRDPNLTSSDLLTKATKRHHSKHVSDNEIVKHKVSHSPQQVIDAQYKQLSKLKPMSKQPNKPNSESVPPPKDTKYEHFSKVKMSPKSHQDFQASRKTKEERPPSTSRSEDHQAAIKEISGIDENSPSMKIQSNLSEGDQSPKKEDEKSTKPNPGIDDKLTSSKLKNSSSGREQTPAEEDKQSSKSHQVEVLTSRTPPTSLLTTSNDDNTYSIKQIVQGPRGSSFVYGIHNDDKVYNLEKKVSRLESEVTVLETAMADLAKRLLVVEQKSEVPQPTMPTIIHSSIKSEPEEKHPAHNQQTNVYISKDEAPKLPNPEKIVIPISSLFPERSGHVSKPSHFIHEEQETKVDTHLENEDQVKPQDSARLSLRGGAQSSPSSEAHAVVRPIVNIIVPNNRADLFPDGVSPACIPRCQNGGRCLEGNSCRCPTFFTGDHCERFSLKDLLESPDLRERPYRKLQRIVVSEPPDRQILDGTLNLDSGPPAAVEYRDISQYRDLNQDTLPAKEFVAKQQRTESTLPTNDAEIDGGSRRRQLILEI